MFEYLSNKLLALAEKVRIDKPRPAPRVRTYSEIDINEKIPVHILDKRNENPGRLQIGKAMCAIHLRDDEPIYAGITLGNITPDEGENLILDMIVGSQALLTNTYLHLVNTPTIGNYAESTVYSGITLVSGGSYGGKTLARGTNWTISAPAGATQAQADQQTWTASGGAFTTAESVVVASTLAQTGVVLWQHDLSTARTLQDTDQLQVTFTAALTLE